MRLDSPKARFVDLPTVNRTETSFIEILCNFFFVFSEVHLNHQVFLKIFFMCYFTPKDPYTEGI